MVPSGKLLNVLLHCNSPCACLLKTSKFHHHSSFVNKIILHLHLHSLCISFFLFFLQEVNSCGILSCNLFRLIWIILGLRFTLFSNKLLVSGILFCLCGSWFES